MSGFRHKLFFLLVLMAMLFGGGERAFAELQTDAVNQEIVFDKFPEQEMALSSTNVVNGERETLDVPVVSWRDMPFQTVKKQALDYSCGSAALSTLLTHVYGDKTSEGAIFKAMFDQGDQVRIRKEGFSLLDMSKYLNAKGYKAVGYKVGLDSLAKSKAPFVALINDNGYNHFVVVKSIKGPHILVGDPNKGNVIHERSRFEKIWNGIALVVVNNAQKGRKIFENDKEWRLARVVVDPSNADYPGIDGNVLPSHQWQISPMTTDLLSSVNFDSLSGIGGVQ
jgi:predicted double-glycine peptidase